MNYSMLAEGIYPALEVRLELGEKVVTEAGAMAWMDDGLELKTSARGGAMASLKRSMLGGESLFQNEYTAKKNDARLVLVAGQPGHIKAMEMTGQELFLERGAYLASSPTITTDTKFQGLKGLFAEGVFALKASGTGVLFWTAYGDIEEVPVAGDYLVDNGYAVAWDSTLQYTVTKTGKSIRTALFSDQLIMRFSGHGRVWVQSRSPRSLASFVWPFRPVKKNN